MRRALILGVTTMYLTGCVGLITTNSQSPGGRFGRRIARFPMLIATLGVSEAVLAHKRREILALPVVDMEALERELGEGSPYVRKQQKLQDLAAALRKDADWRQRESTRRAKVRACASDTPPADCLDQPE